MHVCLWNRYACLFVGQLHMFVGPICIFVGQFSLQFCHTWLNERRYL